MRSAVSAPIPAVASSAAGADLHVIGAGSARVLHMRHGTVPDELRIELLGQFMGAEFLIKIPQHFGLGEGERAIRRVRRGAHKEGLLSTESGLGQG